MLKADLLTDSVPPEQLLRALLLEALYTDPKRAAAYLLFRWFVGLGIDDRVWAPG